MADLRGNGFWMGVNLISNFADILNEQRLNKEKFLKEISDKSDLINAPNPTLPTKKKVKPLSSTFYTS